MERVRPGPGYEIYNRRTGKAEFRAEIRLLYLKLLDRIYRWFVNYVLNAAVLLKVGRRGAIHQYIGSRVTAACRIEVHSGSISGGFATGVSVDKPGSQKDQVV